jgi:hypothetical protein
MWRGEVGSGDVELEDEVQPREVFSVAFTRFPVPTLQSMSRQLSLNPSLTTSDESWYRTLSWLSFPPGSPGSPGFFCYE